MFNKSYSNPTTIHDAEEGDSQIYVGIKYLGIVGQQINEIRMAEKLAFADNSMIALWLNELRTFYDLIENRTGMNNSNEEIELFEYTMNEKTKTLERKPIKVKEKEKYEKWFEQIQMMIERNAIVVSVGGNPFHEKKYINNKKILFELSKCHRELLRDANKRHLIMPEGIKDMKRKVNEEWLDRDPKKEFS